MPQPCRANHHRPDGRDRSSPNQEEDAMPRQVIARSAIEKPIGFSRAVRVGNLIAVSGTAPRYPAAERRTPATSTARPEPARNDQDAIEKAGCRMRMSSAPTPRRSTSAAGRMSPCPWRVRRRHPAGQHLRAGEPLHRCGRLVEIERWVVAQERSPIVQLNPE